MSDSIIIAENLGKKYLLRHQQNRQKYNSLRDVVSNKFKAIAQQCCNVYKSHINSDKLENQEYIIEDFWALRDVSFEIKRGETVGIIGRNGAGKSTLLKILSRITEPTTGRFRLRGRMASLLEVGTGFHPELTGRENVFLNGAILGMRREEIKRKFDEIVAFAEVEKFLDTPVKRYSSGMYVRLAFAVAAHLEPEILVIDEVLAVGDVEFQKKCLGKMGRVAQDGRTVFFVSHNMAAVAELCSRVIHLYQGQIIDDGDSNKIIASYLASGVQDGYVDLSNWNLDRQGEQNVRIISLETLDRNLRQKSIFCSGDSIQFRIGIFGEIGLRCTVGVSLRDSKGSVLIHLPSVDQFPDLILPDSKSFVDVKIDSLPLNEGAYYVTIWLGDVRNMLQDRVGNCLSFTVDNTLLGQSKCSSIFCVSAKWSIKSTSII